MHTHMHVYSTLPAKTNTSHQIRAKFHRAAPKSRGTQEHCSVLLDTQSPPLGAGDCWSDLPDKQTPPKQTQHELCLTLLSAFRHPCVWRNCFGISLEGKMALCPGFIPTKFTTLMWMVSSINIAHQFTYQTLTCPIHEERHMVNKYTLMF